MTPEALATLVTNVGLSGGICLFFIWTTTKRYEALQTFVQEKLLGIIERNTTSNTTLATSVDELAIETRAVYQKLTERPCMAYHDDPTRPPEHAA